jgi:hypothetical protein
MEDRGLDLDSHADMAVLGSNCVVFEDTGRTITVHSYDPELGSSVWKVVSAAFAYDDPVNGQTILLIVHQGLHIPHLPYSLIPPFQMRENDIIVNERPKFQSFSPTWDDHAIIVEQNDRPRYRLPISLHGTSSNITVRRPTDTEFSDLRLTRFELTYSTPDWVPGSPQYSEMEQRLQMIPRYTHQQGTTLEQIVPNNTTIGC